VRSRPRPFRKTFGAGLLIILPTLVTLFLLNFVLDQVDRYFTPFLLRLFPRLDLLPPAGVPDETHWRVIVPALGLLLALGLVYVIGRLGSHVVGRRAIRSLEQQVLRVPLVKGIYGAARQLVHAFGAQQGESFSRVVLIEYPRKDVWALAFVTKDVHPQVQAPLGRDDLIFVFVPTTPNPSSGFLLAVPESELRDTGLSVEAGLKTIVSGGMVSLGPEEPAGPAES
jgi:uncharacterized membrane protein